MGEALTNVEFKAYVPTTANGNPTEVAVNVEP